MNEHWKSTTIEAITEVVTKGTTPTSVGFKFTESGINFVKVETITPSGQFLPSKFGHIDEDCHQSLKRSQLAPGDILFSIAGALGRTAQVTPEILPANTNQALAIIRLKPSPDVMPEFILRALSSGLMIEQIEKQRGGVAQQNLSLAQVKNFQIPLPPLSEQKKIVSIVDEAFEAIDIAIDNTKQNLTNARELFDSYLNAIFTQKGDGWEETSLGAEIDLMTGFPFKSNRYTDSEQSIRLLRGDNIIQGSLRWDDVKKWPESELDEYLTYQLKEGDVVLAMDRPWVKAGLKHAMISSNDLPCLLVQRTACIRGFKDIDNRFLMNLIGSRAFIQHILSNQTGIGVPHISGKQIQSFRFLKPPLSEQNSISDNLEELRSKVQRLEAIYQQKLIALNELKQSILHKAFTGELTADKADLKTKIEPEAICT